MNLTDTRRELLRLHAHYDNLLAIRTTELIGHPIREIDDSNCPITNRMVRGYVIACLDCLQFYAGHDMQAIGLIIERITAGYSGLLAPNKSYRSQQGDLFIDKGSYYIPIELKIGEDRKIKASKQTVNRWYLIGRTKGYTLVSVLLGYITPEDLTSSGRIKGETIQHMSVVWEKGD